MPPAESGLSWVFPLPRPSWSVLEEKNPVSQSPRAGWSLSLCLVRVRGLELREMEDNIVS